MLWRRRCVDTCFTYWGPLKRECHSYFYLSKTIDCASGVATGVGLEVRTLFVADVTSYLQYLHLYGYYKTCTLFTLFISFRLLLKRF